MRNPHLDLDGERLGAQAGAAAVAVVLLHGRAQSPAFMLDIARRMAAPHAAYVALGAEGGSWYPQSFLAPLEANRPHLDWALERVEAEVGRLEAEGWARRRIVLMGFSQGACLACEYLYRHPARWGGLIAFTGGLVGPPGAERAAAPALAGVPMLLTNGDRDGWVPLDHTRQTAAVFERSGAAVDVRVFPDRPHEVCDQEIAAAVGFLGGFAPVSSPAI